MSLYNGLEKPEVRILVTEGNKESKKLGGDTEAVEKQEEVYNAQYNLSEKKFEVVSEYSDLLDGGVDISAEKSVYSKVCDNLFGTNGKIQDFLKNSSVFVKLLVGTNNIEALNKICVHYEEYCQDKNDTKLNKFTSSLQNFSESFRAQYKSSSILRFRLGILNFSEELMQVSLNQEMAGISRKMSVKTCLESDDVLTVLDNVNEMIHAEPDNAFTLVNIQSTDMIDKWCGKQLCIILASKNNKKSNTPVKVSDENAMDIWCKASTAFFVACIQEAYNFNKAQGKKSHTYVSSAKLDSIEPKVESFVRDK